MRKLLLPLAASVAAIFSASAIDYNVTGKISGLDGKKMYMFDYDIKKNIDSALISDGTFTFKGSYPRPALVRIENGQHFSNCVIDPAPVVVDFTTHLPSSGSETNMKLNIPKEKEREIDVKIGALRDSIMALQIPEEEKIAIFEPKSKPIIGSYIDWLEDFIVENPDGVGESAIMTYGNQIFIVTPEKWNALYNRLPAYLKGLEVTKHFNKTYSQMAKAAEGKPFIDFMGLTLDGKDAKLSDYVGKGKYVLVDFWASWCGPCRQEAETVLKPLYQKYASHPKFEILGVGVWEDAEQTKAFLDKSLTLWPQIIGTGQEPMNLYGFQAIPMIILFGPDGTILKRQLRGDNLVKAVEEVLK